LTNKYEVGIERPIQALGRIYKEEDFNLLERRKTHTYLV